MVKMKKRILIRAFGLILGLSLVILLFNPVRTLLSFQKNDEIPLYTMRYYGPYYYLTPTIPYSDANLNKYSDSSPLKTGFGLQENQACTIFSATGGSNKIYGRNRDMYDQNTALLLFTHPRNGYASVSLVDLSQLGADPGGFLLWRRLLLLVAPLLPTEGMNEHGLTIAKADVQSDDPPYDKAKETLLFRTAMRVVLDQAKTTQEAIELLAGYNISFGGGGGHFLIADPTGDSAIVEYFENEVKVIRNPDPWQVITNFNVANTTDMSEEGSYERFKITDDALRERDGVLSMEEGMVLLNNASVSGTIWSIVFDMTTLDMDIVLYRQFSDITHLSREDW